MCTYYDSPEDKNSEYYDHTDVYDSVADAMIEAANTLSNQSDNYPRDIEVKIFEIKEDFE